MVCFRVSNHSAHPADIEGIAYAVYFDYKRRNDPQFRKQLKKESKRQAKAAKEEAEAHTVRQRQAIRAAVEEAKEEGFPSDVEEREAYFMQEVAQGEGLAGAGMWLFTKTGDHS